MDVESKIESTRIGVAAGSVAIYGITLNEWVALFTLLYMLLQIFILLPKAIKTFRSYFDEIRGRDEPQE